jgi:hypothetical protein
MLSIAFLSRSYETYDASRRRRRRTARRGPKEVRSSDRRAMPAGCALEMRLQFEQGELL